MDDTITSAFFIRLIIVLTIGLVLDFFVSRSFQNIAEMKGHNGKPYFWWTFWVGPVGMMMVTALPDRNMTVSISEETMKRMSESVKTPASAYAPSSDELPSL